MILPPFDKFGQDHDTLALDPPGIAGHQRDTPHGGAALDGETGTRTKAAS
jgi:hypothetical protein